MSHGAERPRILQSAAKRIPKEHGAWVMIIVPMVLAAVAARSLTAPGLLCVAAALAAFCSRSPALALLKLRGRPDPEIPPLHDAALAAVYVAAAAACGLALVVGWERWVLVWFAAGTLAGIGVYTLAYLLRWDRAFGWQLVFVVGLTQTGPALYVAEVGRLSTEAWALWGLTASYFFAGLLYVYLRLRELKENRPAQASRWRLLLVCAALTAGAALAGAYRLAPAWSALALLPTLGRAAYLAAAPKASRTTLKAIGREELWMAVAFTALGLMAFFLASPDWYVGL